MAEIDISYQGLRLRTMDVLPDGGAMILSEADELCALFTPREGWRGSRAARDFKTIVLSEQTLAVLVSSAPKPANYMPSLDEAIRFIRSNPGTARDILDGEYGPVSAQDTSE